MSEKDGKMVVTDPAAWRKIRIWQWVKFGLPQMLMRALWSLFAPLEPVVNFAYGMGIIVLHLFFAIASIAFAPTVWCSLELACRHAKVKNATHGTRGEICRHAWYSFVAFVVEVVSFISLVAVLCDCGKDWRSMVCANPMLVKIGIALIATNCVSAIHELGRWMRMPPAQPVQQATAPAKNEVVMQKPVLAVVTPVVIAPVSDRIAHLVNMATQEKLALTLTNDSVETLVSRGGYNWANPNITDLNFPAPASGTGATTALLLGFSEDVTTEEVEAVAEAMGLRLGNARDGAHFGVQHPERQRANHLVCLGDSWQASGGGPHVVVLYDSAGNRELDLYYRAFGWNDYCRFLAVRK